MAELVPTCARCGVAAPIRTLRWAEGPDSALAKVCPPCHGDLGRGARWSRARSPS